MVNSEDAAEDAAPSQQPHRVLIASEEQFKTFTLPTLKPCGKYKLTAHEGARIRKMGFTTFVSRSDSEYAENCFTCLTNQGGNSNENFWPKKSLEYWLDIIL